MVHDLGHAVIDDEEGFLDFRDALSDYAPRIEALVALLRSRPGDRDALFDLFRTVHNIKGDASLCRLEFLVPFVHAVENLLSRVRAGEAPFTPSMADVLLLAIDRLQLVVDVLASRQPLADLRLADFTSALEVLCDSTPAEGLNAACRHLIESVTGVEMPDEGETGVVEEDEADAGVEASMRDASGDLAFFQELAIQFEGRSALFAGRTARNLRLALLVNQLAGAPVDADQLSAAVYMHDVGMMFLREAIWTGNAQLSDEDRQRMREHPAWAAGMLQRIPGWERAARIVLQHHEKPDGSGYPQHMHSTQIDPGAQIIALVDAFEAVMVKQLARGQAHSILRAVAEVNAAADRQFDARWIDAFNRAVRRLLQQA